MLVLYTLALRFGGVHDTKIAIYNRDVDIAFAIVARAEPRRKEVIEQRHNGDKGQQEQEYAEGNDGNRDQNRCNDKQADNDRRPGSRPKAWPERRVLRLRHEVKTSNR